MDGVVHTFVGYAGGTSKNPTYGNIGDHAETVKIEYDPSQVPYEELLRIFWDSHNPTVRVFIRQYTSIIFYYNEEQKRLAIESRDLEEQRLGAKIYTEIIPATEFYMAEMYHQKYSLQQVPELMKDFSQMYPNAEDFVASTAAARINGYLGGYGTLDSLEEQLSGFGLSPAAEAKLIAIASVLLPLTEDASYCPVGR